MIEVLSLRLLSLGLFVCATAAAQTQEVRISGRVTGSMGAVLPQACVTLKGSGSAAKATMLTDGKGEFAFGGLAPGSYDLSFTWRFRPYDTFVFKPRCLTLKADDKENVVPPVVLETGQVTIDYDYDSWNEYRSQYSHGAEELHNQCTLDLGNDGVTCPSTPEEVAASNRKDHYLRIEADGQKLYMVPLSGLALARGQPRWQASEPRCPASGYPSQPLRIDNLPEANLICGLAKSGRRAMLAVGFKEVCVPGSVIIFFETKHQQ